MDSKWSSEILYQQHLNQLKQISLEKNDRVHKVNTNVLDQEFTCSVLEENLTIAPANKAIEYTWDKYLNQGYTYGPPTKYLAIDCEMDGGPTFYRDNVIRISIINEEGNIVLETLMKPLCEVLESRAFIHGIDWFEYEHAIYFKIVQSLITKLSQDRIFIGHSTLKDLAPLDLQNINFIDIANYEDKKQPQSLKNLSQTYLNADIQSGSHSSLVDARVTMGLFLTKKELFSTKAKILNPTNVDKETNQEDDKYVFMGVPMQKGKNKRRKNNY